MQISWLIIHEKPWFLWKKHKKCIISANITQSAEIQHKNTKTSQKMTKSSNRMHESGPLLYSIKVRFAAIRERSTVYLLCIFNIACQQIALSLIFWVWCGHFSMKVQINAKMLTCSVPIVSHWLFLLWFFEHFFSLDWGFSSGNPSRSHASIKMLFSGEINKIFTFKQHFLKNMIHFYSFCVFQYGRNACVVCK